MDEWVLKCLCVFVWCPLTQVGEGKSGMLFFSTADREFIVKTVTRNELKFLERYDATP